MTWKQRLACAKRAGKFTDDDCYRAQEWTSCAVSERPRLQRIEGISTPRSERLRYLGVQFMRAVEFNNVGEAMYCYRLIHQYSKRPKKGAPS